MFSSVSYRQGKAIRRTKRQIGLIFRFDQSVGFGIPCSLFFGSYMDVCVTRMRSRSCTNILRSNKLRSSSGNFLFIRIGEVVSPLYRSAAIRASRTLSASVAFISFFTLNSLRTLCTRIAFISFRSLSSISASRPLDTLLALNSLRTLFALQSSKLLNSEIRISERITLVALIALCPLQRTVIYPALNGIININVIRIRASNAISIADIWGGYSRRQCIDGCIISKHLETRSSVALVSFRALRTSIALFAFWTRKSRDSYPLSGRFIPDFNDVHKNQLLYALIHNVHFCCFIPSRGIDCAWYSRQHYRWKIMFIQTCSWPLGFNALNATTISFIVYLSCYCFDVLEHPLHCRPI